MVYAFLTVEFNPSFSKSFLPATRPEQLGDDFLIIFRGA
jgi:hypothetical protein